MAAARTRMISLSGQSWLNLSEVVHFELSGANGYVTLKNGQKLALLGDEVKSLTTVLDNDTAPARQLRQELRRAERERAAAAELAAALRRKVQRLLADNVRLTRQLDALRTDPAGAVDQVNG